jgi:cytosine/adenosine deaminase-related metal-dependent hydrolase
MLTACRAGTVITLAGEKAARGRAALDAPLRSVDNAVILAENGTIIGVEPYPAFRRRVAAPFSFTDAGDVCLMPGLINAHCHLELSHTRGKCVRGKGFTQWLRSLLAVLRTSRADEEALAAAMEAMRTGGASGTAHIGDVGSRRPDMVRALAERLSARDGNGKEPGGLRPEKSPERTRDAPAPGCAEGGARYPLTHFLELIGFSAPAPDTGVPEELRAGPWFLPAASALPPRRYADCALAGHALYSTAPEALRAAHDFCRRTGRVFCMHLAESPEEDECIRNGKGPLHALMSGLLPAPTRAWGTSPAALAGKLGLLGPGTLAVHCVRLSPEDGELLSRSGCAVCLCPRSNEYTASGRAEPTMPEAEGILFCLGTDGLSSNTDVDMRKETAAARAAYGLSARAALRMASVNGAAALGLNSSLGTLEAGKAAVFAVLDPDTAREL